ncbi:hypothetical protein L211DRAFT_80589 [Terfezia boudieri ATCC MYA-4762]|uniref:Uncharacterized protein n=1 Tax=Terfezia boudieri ATCC MYA-4762 TaxID=1051890 RepID=A0A3N4L689_9PEZI|nr:hypothetical protein L211DRAFT_80589 [Terfezia boudieri ATCC MYA-4762]
MDELDQLDLVNYMKRFLLLAGKLSLKVIITSRPRDDIISLTKQSTVLNIPRVEINRDIRRYLNERLERTFLRYMKEEITKALCPQTEIMFLFVRLVVDDLELGSRTKKDVYAKLKNLPTSLTNLYEQSLEKLEGEPGKLGDSLLIYTGDEVRSVCFPLIEILENERVQVVHTSVSEFIRQLGRRLGQIRSGKSLFCDGEPGAQKCLIPYFQSEVARACLSYLSVPPEDLDQPPNRDFRDFRTYAVSNWQHHSRQAGSQSENLQEEREMTLKQVTITEHIATRDTVSESLEDYAWIRNPRSWERHLDYERETVQRQILAFKSLVESRYQWKSWILDAAEHDLLFKVYFGLRLPTSRPPSPLHVLAYYGLHHLAAALFEPTAQLGTAYIDPKPWILEKDGMGGTPLHVAAERASPFLKLLLLYQPSESINNRDAESRTSIHRAVGAGNTHSVQLLGAAGADIGLVDNMGRTALHLDASNR